MSTPLTTFTGNRHDLWRKGVQTGDFATATPLLHRDDRILGRATTARVTDM